MFLQFISCSSYQTQRHNLASVTVWSKNGPHYHWLQVLRHNQFVRELSGIHNGYLLAAMFLQRKAIKFNAPNKKSTDLSKNFKVMFCLKALYDTTIISFEAWGNSLNCDNMQ